MFDIEIKRKPGGYSYLISFFASIIILTSINPVNAAIREYPKKQEMVAEEEAGSLTKWEDIYRSFMIHDVITYILWGAFFASIILTVLAVMKKSIRLLVIAAVPLLIMYAVLGFLFGIEGVLVSGLLGLLLTCLQTALIIGYIIKARTLGWILLFIAAIVAWISVWAYVGNPFEWKGVGTL